MLRGQGLCRGCKLNFHTDLKKNNYFIYTLKLFWSFTLTFRILKGIVYEKPLVSYNSNLYLLAPCQWGSHAYKLIVILQYDGQGYGVGRDRSTNPGVDSKRTNGQTDKQKDKSKL